MLAHFEFRLDIFEDCSFSCGAEKSNCNSYAEFQDCAYVVYYSLLKCKFLVYVT